MGIKGPEPIVQQKIDPGRHGLVEEPFPERRRSLRKEHAAWQDDAEPASGTQQLPISLAKEFVNVRVARTTQVTAGGSQVAAKDRQARLQTGQPLCEFRSLFLEP